MLVAAVGKLFGISIISAIRVGLLLAPGGEFAFVAFGEAVNQMLSFSRRVFARSRHTSAHSRLDSERMELFQKVEKGVLHLSCGGRRGGVGTAFVINKRRGELMTAGHTVLRQAWGVNLKLGGPVEVTMPGLKDSCTALVAAVAPVRDLAILKVDPDYIADSYEFRFGDKLPVGATIFSVGHGDWFSLFREGMVSSAPLHWKELSKAFRHSASLVTGPAPEDFTVQNMDMGTAGGSSGSPVFGLDGKVIGVVKCGMDDELDLSTFYVPAQHVVEFVRLFRRGLLKKRNIGGVALPSYD